MDDNKNLVVNFLNENWPEEDKNNKLQIYPSPQKVTARGQRLATKKAEEYIKTVRAGKEIVAEMFEFKREVGKLNNVHIAIGTDKKNLQSEFITAKQKLDGLLNQGELQEEQRKTGIMGEKAKQAEHKERIANAEAGEAKSKKNIKDSQISHQPRKSREEIFEDKIIKETNKSNQKDMVAKKIDEELKNVIDRGEREGWSESRIEQEKDQIISRWHHFIQKNIF